MNERKRRIESFSFYDYTAIERHLEAMARKGWQLETVDKCRWTYRRAEPADLRYTVVYFPEYSQFDPGPTEGQRTLQDYCAAAGWHLAADCGQMQIFFTDLPDPVPIDTDPEIQLATVRRAMRRTMLPGHLTLLALLGFQLWIQFRDLYWSPAEYLSRVSRLAALPLYLLGILVAVWELSGYGLWLLRSRASIARGGGCVPSPGHAGVTKALLAGMVLALLGQLLSLGNGVYWGFMAVYLIGLVLVFRLSWKLQTALKRRKFSRRANRAATLVTIAGLTILMLAGSLWGLLAVLRTGALDRPAPETYTYHGSAWNVYHDSIPLRVEDLRAVDYDGWSTELEVSDSPLVCLTTASQTSRLGDGDYPELEYEIADVKVPSLLGPVVDGYLRQDLRYDLDLPEQYQRVFRPIDAAAWSADEAYRQYEGESPRNLYLVRWGSRVVRIQFWGQWEPTAAQTAAAAQLLRP